MYALDNFPDGRLCFSRTTMPTRAMVLTISGVDLLDVSNRRSLTLRGTVAPAQDHVPIYTSPETFESIRNMFRYMVDPSHATGGGDIPSFRWHTFDPSKPFTISSCGGIAATPLPVEHGMYFADGLARPYMCMGFRIGEVSYISDTNRIPDDTKEKIQGSRILILDALRETPHASHFCFDEVSHSYRE